MLLRVNFVLDKNGKLWYNIYTVKSTKLLKDNIRERGACDEWMGQSKSMHNVNAVGTSAKYGCINTM